MTFRIEDWQIFAAFILRLFEVVSLCFVVLEAGVFVVVGKFSWFSFKVGYSTVLLASNLVILQFCWHRRSWYRFSTKS